MPGMVNYLVISNDLKITDVSGRQAATQTNQSPTKKEKKKIYTTKPHDILDE